MKHASRDKFKSDSTVDGADEFRLHRRADAVGVLLVVLLSVVMLISLGRVFQLQIEPGEQLSAHIADRMSTTANEGLRAGFVDRRGRLLASSHFGYRAFVDPARLPADVVPTLAKLGDVLDVPLATLTERVVPRMDQNTQRREARTHDPSAPGLIRYVRVSELLSPDDTESIRALKLPGVHVERIPVRSLFNTEFVSAIVGKTGAEHEGRTGLEQQLDKQVQPSHGSLTYVRDAKRRAMWIEAGRFSPAARLEPVRLSIDLVLQQIAIEELKRGVRDAGAQGGRIVLLDSHTGEVLAMADVIEELPDVIDFDFLDPFKKYLDGSAPRYRVIRPDPARDVESALARNRCAEDMFEPGSIFKPFMWAAATELGLVDPDSIIETFDGRWRTPYGRRLNDVTQREKMTWVEVLVNSSNIGMAQVTALMSHAQMRDAVLRFGFGQRTELGLAGESPGMVTPLRSWSKYTQTSVSMGHEIGVTPLQIARAFCVFARPGDDAGILPMLSLLAARPDDISRDFRIRVLPSSVANLARQAMSQKGAQVVERMLTWYPEEAPGRFTIFGKSGTAVVPVGSPPEGVKRMRGTPGYLPEQYISSFLAGAPVESPRLVVLVTIEDPSHERIRAREHYGSRMAGPTAVRVLNRGLEYLGY